MHLKPQELQEWCAYLDMEWESWQHSPRYKADEEAQEMDMFLTIHRALASSIDNAYIDAWHEQHQQPQT